MIAHAGLLAYRTGFRTPLEDATCTQRFRYAIPPVNAARKDLTGT